MRAARAPEEEREPHPLVSATIRSILRVKPESAAHAPSGDDSSSSQRDDIPTEPSTPVARCSSRSTRAPCHLGLVSSGRRRRLVPPSTRIVGISGCLVPVTWRAHAQTLKQARPVSLRRDVSTGAQAETKPEPKSPDAPQTPQLTTPASKPVRQVWRSGKAFASTRAQRTSAPEHPSASGNEARTQNRRTPPKPATPYATKQARSSPNATTRRR